MSIKHLQTLSMNPHFYAKLLQCFLTGYGKPCEIRLFFMALPILLYAESRNKLANARSDSKLETLFNAPQELKKDTKISGKVRLSGYLNRFQELKGFAKKALIILYSQKKIVMDGRKLALLETVNFSDYKGNIRSWLKSAHYLGAIFAKTNEEHLNYFLGVDKA